MSQIVKTSIMPLMSPSLCILFFLLPIHFLTEQTNGMKLSIIHPESPESPIFERNLTHEQRIQRLIVRPQVRTQSPYNYMVEIGIGNFITKPPNPSFKSYYLYMDTGSDLLWLQCEGCRAPGGRCFPQKYPVYPNKGSGSYHPLPCNKHNLCVPNQCINRSCSYNIQYLDSTSSSGILASETFSFNSDVGKNEVVKNLVFGCGVDNRKNYGYSENKIAGIMGLGWGSYSILSQANSITQGKFSYCLPEIKKQAHTWPNTYLRFGKDIINRANLSVTPLLRHKDQKAYHLILQGISVDNKRLKNISDQHFKIRDNGSGGCIIDSGTPFSRLIKPAYVVLEKALKSYFWGQIHLKPYKGPQGFKLCYERKKGKGYKSLPNLTFHFKNASLIVRPESLFFVMDKINSVKDEYFCLAIIESDYISVLGSYQQTNQRFIYDTKQKHLLFRKEDCSKDA